MTISGSGSAAKQNACGSSGGGQFRAPLAWYDRHRRRLPWRALPGEPRDAYRVWLSEIMLQQTTVKAVGPYFEKFVTCWPDVAALAGAPLDDVLRMWAGLGYYSRARNLHACAMTVAADYGGRFPTPSRSCARCRYRADTAAAIAAIAFDVPVVPVDGNIERVVRVSVCGRTAVAECEAIDPAAGTASCSARRAPATPRRH